MSGSSDPLIISFGEMLIDFVPDTSGVSLAESRAFIKAPGGAPANVACAISKLGGNAAFIGKVGDDEFGRMLVDILKKNGVHTDGVCFDMEARTALAFVTLRKDGEREFMFYRNPSADMLLKESELNMDLIKNSKIFHYGSISLISEPCRSAHLAAMRAAREGGALLSYDPNVRLPLWPSPEAARSGIKSIWSDADFIKVTASTVRTRRTVNFYFWGGADRHWRFKRFSNIGPPWTTCQGKMIHVSDDEVEFLTQKDPEQEDVIMSLWHDKLKLLLVTDGEKGCRYVTKKFKGRVSGFSVKAVDTTGAGDSFVGALLTAVARDTSIFDNEPKLREALTFANACGAMCTTQKGAIPALPTAAEAQKFISSSKAN